MSCLNNIKHIGNIRDNRRNKANDDKYKREAYQIYNEERNLQGDAA